MGIIFSQLPWTLLHGFWHLWRTHIFRLQFFLWFGFQRVDCIRVQTSPWGVSTLRTRRALTPSHSSVFRAAFSSRYQFPFFIWQLGINGCGRLSMAAGRRRLLLKTQEGRRTPAERQGPCVASPQPHPRHTRTHTHTHHTHHTHHTPHIHTKHTRTHTHSLKDSTRDASSVNLDLVI